MKWLLTFNIYLAAAGIAVAQPMPMAGTLPHPAPLSTAPTVPSPTLSGASNWHSESYAAPAAATCSTGCSTPQGCAKSGGSAFDRFCQWIAFRPCAPVHTMCVPQPPRAPLRSYFSNSACGVGCANATDCGSKCGKGRGCSTGNDSVFIPPPKRSCASANCGGSPMWGRGSCSTCSSGLLGKLMGGFGLSEGSCGSKGCGSCGGGCSSCQYTKTPMSDIGQYHNFTVTQSAGRISGLSNTGAAPAGSHYANPYKAASAELYYPQPAATLAPATPMPAPQQPMSQGTNPFPGPNGTLPHSKPFTNP